MSAWVVVLTAIFASGASAPPPPEPAPAVEPTQPRAAAVEGLPSVRVQVVGDEEAGEVEFLRGALVVRLLDQGYCLTSEAAEVDVRVERGEGQMLVQVAREGVGTSTHTIPGTGAVAALEAIHRVDAAVGHHRGPELGGRACREVAVPLRIEDDGDEADATLVRGWVAGLSSTGASLVRGEPTSPDRVCLVREPDGLVVGRGVDCTPVVSLPSRDAADPKQQIERAVGAALAVARHAREATPVEVEPRPDADPDPVAPVSEAHPGSAAVAPSSEPTTPPAERRARSPVATLHALVAGGAAARRGGIDGVAVLVAGVQLRPGIIAAADLTVLPARLQHRVVTVDTDIAGDLGYRLPLAERSGLRFTLAAGARVHTWRTDGGPTSRGRTTWIAGLGVAGWWRIGRDLTIEVGLRQRFSGHGWLHEVGLDVAGERGRSTTMLVAGLGWLGRRR